MTLDITAAYQAHAAELRAYLYRRAPDIYEDIAGDVWERVCRYAHAYQDTGHLRAWLFQIAHRRLIDVRRSWAQRSIIPIGPYDWLVPFLEPIDVAELLAPLTEKQRRVVLDRIAGYSNAEIAARLGLEYHTVKSLVWRARRRLSEAA